MTRSSVGVGKKDDNDNAGEDEGTESDESDESDEHGQNSKIGETCLYLVFQCDCAGDVDCLNARRRIEACRHDVVYANRLDTVVSCTEAQWICTADAECSKALEYYNLLCRGMFKGKRCNQRCKNSIQILGRQTKAIKLGEFSKTIKIKVRGI